jgi:hypothetical protein
MPRQARGANEEGGGKGRREGRTEAERDSGPNNQSNGAGSEEQRKTSKHQDQNANTVLCVREPLAAPPWVWRPQGRSSKEGRGMENNERRRRSPRSKTEEGNERRAEKENHQQNAAVSAWRRRAHAGAAASARARQKQIERDIYIEREREVQELITGGEE